MRLKSLEINGFKSFAQKSTLEFDSPVVCVVGPNGSGKSNVVESIRYVLGEQSMKSMRGKSGLDLIFKGSKNLPKGSKATVSIYFNNSDKVFKLTNDNGENVNLNYDTVSISREVYADGLNKYILNGTEVRLKDIHNLLSSVNVGASGHHIISQGEADRILNASSKDRKEMVEDALGLKIYQYKIKESERKLERTEANMKEVALLRRENAPHLNFLRKQVEKLEKVKQLQIDLSLLYREYLKKENIYLEAETHNLKQERNKIEEELAVVNTKIQASTTENSPLANQKIEELRAIERKINEIRGIKNEMERKLGRIEGMIEMEENRRESAVAVVEISQDEIRSIVGEINSSIDQAFSSSNIDEIKPILGRIKQILGKFDQPKTEKENNVSQINYLKQSQGEVLSEMDKIKGEETNLHHQAEGLKRDIDKEMEALRDLEREKFTWKVRHQELGSALDLIMIKEGNLKIRHESFEVELRDGVALIGREILGFKDFEIVSDENTPHQSNEELKRKIERLKIKLEDAGLGNGADILKEYKEVSERDQFLEKEVEDLNKSIESLVKLIAELKDKIDIEFKEGVKKINVEFQEFFSLMFGGGTGSLAVVVESKKKRFTEDESLEIPRDESAELDIAFEQGIEINVSLPHKKVKELHALSGGERSLTSIALLFAMSQVNPPPFLVLDETDAALDEANSRKYGDMIEKLSKHSQLIVVTHNRETMSRAGILYGVTVGSNGASKLLSVKFDEAAAIAK